MSESAISFKECFVILSDVCGVITQFIS